MTRLSGMATQTIAQGDHHVIVKQKIHLSRSFWLFRGVVGTAVLLALTTVACVAQQTESPDARKQEIVQFMKDVNFLPRPQYIGKDNALCPAFLEDFKKQRHIRYIEPIVRTDNYDDPALQPYRQKCPRLDLRKLIAVDDRLGYPQGLTEEELELIGIVSYGIGNFQLFKVDIDNDPTDGEEYIFYYEGETYPKKRKTYPQNRAYQVVDFSTCAITGGTYFNRLGSAKWTRNAVIEYKGKYYLYALQSAPGDQPGFFNLALETYSKEKARLIAVCLHGIPLNTGADKKGEK